MLQHTVEPNLMLGTARDITAILELGTRDPRAEAELFKLVQQRFHAIASSMLQGERAGHSLQPTMLVDDAFLQLIRAREQDWRNREEFFSHAARVMRNLLVDHARNRLAAKRGGGNRAVSVESVGELSDPVDPRKLIELEEVLRRLETQHPDVFLVFDLHYFMQYELQEIARDILNTSYTTVRRRWKMARAFLHRELVGNE